MDLKSHKLTRPLDGSQQLEDRLRLKPDTQKIKVQTEHIQSRVLTAILWKNSSHK